MHKILFVCLGNICRSPAAEGVLKHLIEGHPKADQLEVDSAGILDFHRGKPADHRMRAHSLKRGIVLESRSRPFDPDVDFDYFDKIIAMDESNLRDLKSLDQKERYHHKLFLMSDFFTHSEEKNVPDPYYGGDAGFEKVLDLVTEGSMELIKRLEHE